MNPLIARTGQAIGTVIALAVTFVLSALIAFLPLTALPGDLQTNFVNGSWLAPVWIGAFALFLVARLGPLTRQVEGRWWPSTMRFMGRFLSSFVAFFWVTGGLLWLNAFGVTSGHSHTMIVTGVEEVGDRRAVSTLRYYKLREIGTSWRADLQPEHGAAEHLRTGACIAVVVRSGRLGLDWISAAKPVACPR